MSSHRTKKKRRLLKQQITNEINTPAQPRQISSHSNNDNNNQSINNVSAEVAASNSIVTSPILQPTPQSTQTINSSSTNNSTVEADIDFGAGLGASMHLEDNEDEAEIERQQERPKISDGPSYALNSTPIEFFANVTLGSDEKDDGIDLKKPITPESTITVIELVMIVMQISLVYKFNRSTVETLLFLLDFVLPKGHSFPKTMYKFKKVRSSMCL